MNGNDRTVRSTRLDDVVVSTVRLTMDHGHDGMPLWYETMVFAADPNGTVTDWLEKDMDRYTTEAEARAGHEAMVAKWKKGVVA